MDRDVVLDRINKIYKITHPHKSCQSCKSCPKNTVRLVAADEYADQEKRADGDAAKLCQRAPDGKQSRECVTDHARAKRKQGKRNGEAAQSEAHDD